MEITDRQRYEQGRFTKSCRDEQAILLCTLIKVLNHELDRK